MKRINAIKALEILKGIKYNLMDDELANKVFSNYVALNNVHKAFMEICDELNGRLFDNIPMDRIASYNEKAAEFDKETDEAKRISLIKELESSDSEIHKLNVKRNAIMRKLLDSDVNIDIKKVNKMDFFNFCRKSNMNIGGDIFAVLDFMFESEDGGQYDSALAQLNELIDLAIS
ncbi:MAG: hypothetical protein ACI4N3_04105 [Alphaproteobacteria bacterium]